MEIKDLSNLIQKHANGSQARFALLIQKSPSQVNHWLRGIRPLGAKVEKDIYEALGIGLSQATGVAVPLISSVLAGSWGEIQDYPAEIADVVYSREIRPSAHAFALRVEGDSMTSAEGLSFPEGTIIIVEIGRAHV